MRGAACALAGGRRRVGAIAAALGLAAALVPILATAPVLADCAAPISVPQAQQSGDTVFVGTVTAVQNNGTTATVTVDERWKAADSLGDVVQVEQAPDATGATSRKYTRGQWLFDVTYGAPYLEDHACSATSPWTEALAPYRPKGVVKSDGTPQDKPFDLFDMFASDALVPIAALVGALLTAVLAYILILRRRRRPPEWMR